MVYRAKSGREGDFEDFYTEWVQLEERLGERNGVTKEIFGGIFRSEGTFKITLATIERILET